MPKAYVPIAAIIALAGAVPTFAMAAQAQAPRAAAAPQPAPTRAAMVKNLDGNFKSIDTNGDGSLSSAELGAAEAKVQQRRLAQIRAQYDANFTKLDTNKDGQLNKAEFMAAAPTSAGAAPNGAAIVTKLDTNKDGKVSADEYRAPMVTTFDRADANKDGSLSVAERQAARPTQRK